MVHYGGATEDEAITMITLNPAWIMGIDDKTGSLDVGKDGDVVIWNVDSPFDLRARREGVYRWRRDSIVVAGVGHAAVPGGTVRQSTALSPSLLWGSAFAFAP